MPMTTKEQRLKLEGRGHRRFTLVVSPEHPKVDLSFAALSLVIGLVLILGAFGPEPIETARAEGRLHVLVLIALFSVCSAYLKVVSALNTAVIEAERGSLRVRHRPLPWPGVSLDAARVRSFTVRERRTWGKVQSLVYDVRACLDDGSERSCLRGLYSEDHAATLVRTLDDAWRGRSPASP